MRFVNVQTRIIRSMMSLALFGWVVLFATASKVVQAQTLLYVDFETQGTSKTFPDKKFNDASEWNNGAQTKGLVNWINVKHASSGRLHQTLNSNANTTTTVAPAPADCKNWTDYIAQMTVTYDDDDTWPLVFRYKDSNSYYFFAVEQFDSDQGANDPEAFLRKAPAPDGEFNGNNVVGSVKMPGLKIKQGAATANDLPAPVEKEAWVLRVEVKGQDIKCYFFSRDDIKNLDDPAPNPPIIEANDNSNPKGCVGIRNDSIVGTIDDFLVYGPDGFGLSVEAKEKLTTTWGNIKSARY